MSPNRRIALDLTRVQSFSIHARLKALFSIFVKALDRSATRVLQQDNAGWLSNNLSDLLWSRTLYQQVWSLSCLSLEAAEGQQEDITNLSLTFCSSYTHLHTQNSSSKLPVVNWRIRHRSVSEL